MFKNIQSFKITPLWNADLQAVESALAEARFVECGASQDRSLGWVEPREENGPLAESVGGQWILKMLVESKVLPGSVVKEAVAKRIEAIKQQTGRERIGSKQKKEIREDVRNELLSKAFTKKSAILVWIDPTCHRLVIDAASASRADEIISALVKSLDGFAITPIQTHQSPAASMSDWLVTQETPAGFTTDRDCVLKASDDSKASVRYAKHSLDIDEIREHINKGKTPVQLAMTWNDRVSFVLAENGTLKKIEFLDVVVGEHSAIGSNSGFDTDVAIATGELSKLIPDLELSLGGQIDLQPSSEETVPN